MSSHQFVANQFTGLTPESFDEIRPLLQQSKGDAVIVVQQYGLNDGIDIAIWQITDDKKCRKTVFATGPVQKFPRFDSLTHVAISDNEQIPRSVRIEKALVEFEQRPDCGIEDTSLKWAIYDENTVDLNEFQMVKGIVDSLTIGCESVLGADSSVWAIYQNEGNLRCVSRSWNGEMEFEKYWSGMKQILGLAGVLDLPIQSA